MHPLVSVIVPCYNEEKYIQSFIENLLHQDYPKDRLEVFLIDGMSNDRTQEIIIEYQEIHSYLQLLNNEKRFVPFALNKGILMSHGEVILRMDAHSGYPENYISILVDSLFNLKADNVGGIWKTTPANGSALANAIAIASSSVFGVGDASYRLGVKEICRVDTVPFGCFRRKVFDEIGLFDEQLLRNQDDEFNARIIENGGSIYLIPEVEITYFARPDVSSLFKMFYQYAFFKPLVNSKLKRPATIRQFIPPLFVSFLVLGWMVFFISSGLIPIYICGIGMYLIFNLIFTLKLTIMHKKGDLLVYLPFLFLVQHLAYGIGYIAGILRFILFKKSQVSIGTSRN
jgi:glycosyltransferase involved in cell wall biosynthesis